MTTQTAPAAREMIKADAATIMNTLASGHNIVVKTGLYRRSAIHGLHAAGLIAFIVGRNAYTVTLTDAGKARVANRKAGRAAVDAANAEAEADRLAMKADFARREREQEQAVAMWKMQRDFVINRGYQGLD